jgi:hypothetical protein
MTNEQNEFLDRCAAAFRVFEARFPDCQHSEATARLMAAELGAANLDADNADHLVSGHLDESASDCSSRHTGTDRPH